MTTDENPQPSIDTHHPGVTNPQPTVTPAAEPAPRARGRVKAPLLIGIGAGLAVLLVGGAGAAIGLAVTSDEDDDDRASVVVQDDDRIAGTVVASQGAVASDAAALRSALDEAIADADGVGASGIEVEHDGWDVDVILTDGSEVDVHVAADGSAEVVNERPEATSDPTIDLDRFDAIVDAAIDAAGGGTIQSISTDDSGARYEVAVDLGSGREAEVHLAEDLAVVSVEHDD